jgi:uncharacterized protein
MSGSVFLDTSYLLALVRKNDQHHQTAVKGAAWYSGPYATTSLVLVELANCLAAPACRKIAVDVIEKLKADTRTNIVEFDSQYFTETFDLFRKRMDKDWGFVDCFSFLVMEQYGIDTSLCFDIHFKQAGFSVPLLSETASNV